MQIVGCLENSDLENLDPRPEKLRPRASEFFGCIGLGENYLQTHGTAMGTKLAIAFANIFMAETETNLLNQSRIKPIAWKRYIDDVFSLWDTKREDLDIFIAQANKYHPTIKFTAEISDTEIAFLDTVVYKGMRFETESILDIKTHYQPTETFQLTPTIPLATPQV